MTNADRSNPYCRLLQPIPLLFVSLCLLVVLVFHPALQGEFLFWDDDSNIFRNPHLRDLGFEQVFWMFTDTSYYWRYQPLSWLTWNAIFQCFGLRPFYFHLVVVLFHAVNAGLVFVLIERLLRLGWAPQAASGNRSLLICAALAASVWALHPLRVETTAWAVELEYVQALFFFLLAALAYLQWVKVGGSRDRFYLASLACFAASLITFPIALGGLVVFISFDVYPLRRLSLQPRQWSGPETRRVWLEKVPYLAISLAVLWINWLARSHVRIGWGKPATLEEFGLVPRVMQAFYIWASNLWKPLVPVGLTPVPLQLHEFDPWSVSFVLSGLLVTGLTVGCFLLRFRWPALFLVWVCHLALLVPMLGLSERLHYPSDRYNLVVSIGWAILLASVLRRLWQEQTKRRLAISLMVLLIFALGLMSYRQTLIWQTNERFFNHVLTHLPPGSKWDSFRVMAYQRLGEYYMNKRDFAKATTALRDAVRVDPKDFVTKALLAEAMVYAGELDAAIPIFEDCIRHDPKLTPALNLVGIAYLDRGDAARAVECFERVLRYNPGNPLAQKGLARASITPQRTEPTQMPESQPKTLSGNSNATP